MAPRIPNTILVLLISTLLAFSGNGWSMTDQELDDRISALEKKLKKENKKQSKRTKSIQRKFTNARERLTFNGFFSAGVSASDVEAEHIIGVSDDVNYAIDSIITLQTNFVINSKTEAVLQLTGRGTSGQDVEAEWAYLSHSFTPNIVMRAGRLVVPFYSASEYLEVGYAYPWVRPPPDIYNQAPLTAYYGVDLTLHYSLMGWSSRFQIFSGTDKLRLGDIVDANIDNMYGTYFDFDRGPFTIRFGNTIAKIGVNGDLNFTPPVAVTSSAGFAEFNALIEPLVTFNLITLPPEIDKDKLLTDEIVQYQAFLVYELLKQNESLYNVDLSVIDLSSLESGFTQAGADLATAFDLDGLRIEFQDTAFKFDNGTWVLLTEATRFVMEKSFLDISAHYATIGRRFKTLLPYMLYSHSYTTGSGVIANSIGPFIPAIVNGMGFTRAKQKTYSIGLRWDLNSNLAAKIQYDHMTEMDGTLGKFLTSPGANADLYSFVIDGIF